MRTLRTWIIICTVMVCMAFKAGATTFLTFQSTYLGNGWFQYQMNVMDDPFFSEADITGLEINFTNQIGQIGDSTNWGYTGAYQMESLWGFTNGIPARPYSVTSLIQSSETSWRMATNFDGAVVLLSLYFADFAPYEGGDVSRNVVGYCNMPCLVPCDPADADGSPTNFTYVLKLLPDVNINDLIITNGQVYGVDFDWDYESTFVLQGTSNFVDWTNITYVWSYPPETTWTTNVSLGNYGQFFRLELVADGYDTNPPPLSAAVATHPAMAAKNLAISTGPSVTACRFAHGQVIVSLATPAGQTVQVQAVDSHGVVQQTQQITTQGTSATVNFDAAGLPNPVFFRATAAQ